MPHFTIVNLQEDRYDVALPLVRMAAPLTTLESWRAFVRTLFAGTGGIFAAIASDGRPYGIAAYCPDHTLLHGRVLRVEPLVTFELHRSAPVKAALCDALETTARAKGCGTIMISTGHRGYADIQGPKAAAWAAHGFEIASVDLVRRLDPENHLRSEDELVRAGRRVSELS